MSDEGPIELLHGLAFDRTKNKFRLRLTVSRGRKVVGKRLAVWIRTRDQDVAVIARDTAVSLCVLLGLKPARRFQRRTRREEDPKS